MEQAIKTVDVKTLAVAEFSEFDTKLQEFKEKYNVVYDLTDEDQEKKARSDRLAIGKVVSALDTKHKDLKAPLKAQTDLIDGERKRIKDDLLDMQGKIKSQIAAHEQEIQEHADMLQAKVDDLTLPPDFDAMSLLTTDFLKDKIDDITSIVVDDSYEYRKADATLAQIETLKDLSSRFARRATYETEQAELDKLRKEAAAKEQADREEQIRKDAEQKATLEAERAAQAEVDEAKRKQLEAEQAAETATEIERNRIENERLDALEKARQIQVAEDKKKATQNHRAKIHSEAKQSFMDNGFDSAEANVIVSLIKDGKIKNIQVNY